MRDQIWGHMKIYNLPNVTRPFESGVCGRDYRIGCVDLANVVVNSVAQIYRVGVTKLWQNYRSDIASWG